MSRCSCTTSPRAGSRIIRSPARASRAQFCPRLGFSPAETETVAWLIEQHLVMSTRRAVARPVRPQDDREFRRGRAVARAAEAAHHPHHRRHPRGRPRRLERLEGAAPAHALLRDRAGAHRRLLRGQPRAARRHGAGRIPRRAQGLDAGRARRLHRAALSGLLAQGRPAAARSRMRASCARPQQAGKTLATSVALRRRARRHRTDRARARPSLAAVDHRRRLRGGRRQHRRRADLHHHRRAARSTPSRCRASSSATRTRSAAPPASPTRSRRRCAATCGCRRWSPSARAPKARHQGLRGGARGHHQQSVVEPLHHGRGDRPRPARPALRADRDACRSSTSTSPRRMSRPSASAWSTCSTSPTCSGRKITSPTRQAAIKRALIGAVRPSRAEREAGQDRRGGRLNRSAWLMQPVTVPAQPWPRLDRPLLLTCGAAVTAACGSRSATVAAGSRGGAAWTAEKGASRCRGRHRRRQRRTTAPRAAARQSAAQPQTRRQSGGRALRPPVLLVARARLVGGDRRRSAASSGSARTCRRSSRSKSRSGRRRSRSSAPTAGRSRLRGEMRGARCARSRSLPPYLPKAFIAIEDRRFYSHFGIDPIGHRAAPSSPTCMRRGVSQGGSTITQQLAKNLFLTQERTLCAQDAGAGAGALARAQIHQERDPRALSQPRLFRRRRLWRRSRRAALFRQVGARR